ENIAHWHCQLRRNEGAHARNCRRQVPARPRRAESVVLLGGELRQDTVRPEPQLASGDRGVRSGVPGRVGRADKPQEVESIPDLEDHGTLWLCSAESRRARHAHPSGALPKNLAYTTIIETGACGERSGVSQMTPGPGSSFSPAMLF